MHWALCVNYFQSTSTNLSIFFVHGPVMVPAYQRRISGGLKSSLFYPQLGEPPRIFVYGVDFGLLEVQPRAWNAVTEHKSAKFCREWQRLRMQMLHCLSR